MAKYCIKCGIEIPLGAKFCGNCGKRTQPLKKTTKRIIFLSIIIVIAIITSVALFFILQDDTSKFYGTWKVESSVGTSSYDMYWTFYDNSSLRMTSPSYGQTPSITCAQNSTYTSEETSNYSLIVTSVSANYNTANTQWATFEVKDGKIYMSYMGTGMEGSYGWNYDFSNQSYITLEMTGYPYPITLIKTSLPPINQTQLPETIEWKDINISLYGPIYKNYSWISLVRSSSSYYGENCPSEWGNVTAGDVIELGIYDEYLRVSMVWIPTDGLIGSWNFY